MAVCDCVEADLKFESIDWLNLMTKVSVIIPTYNRAHFLAEAIQSVLDQTFTDFELIIVDDGSTDNTEDIVMKFKDPRIRYINQENSGVSAARNTGIKASDGEYIAFLDSDDIWLPQNLDFKVKLLDARPEIGLVCSDAYFYDSYSGAILGRRWHDRTFHGWVDDVLTATQEPVKEMFTRGCFITPQASVIRHSVFNQAGYFDESLQNHEDWDLFVRIARIFSIETIDIPLLKIRRHNDSLSADWDKMYLGAVTVLNKAKSSYYLNDEELKLINQRLARLHFSFGKSLVLNGQINQGREKLLAALKINPGDIRPYIYLAGSLLGDFPIKALKLLAKPFKRRMPISHPDVENEESLSKRKMVNTFDVS